MSETQKEKERLLNLTFDRLEDICTNGFCEWLYSRGMEEISLLEEQINQNFKSNGTVDELKPILREYWVCHIKEIREYELTEDNQTSKGVSASSTI
ncbi:MAG: hypothetical protein ACHQ6U_13250 [Thermodesulfobacteriota bacterium]